MKKISEIYDRIANESDAFRRGVIFATAPQSIMNFELRDLQYLYAVAAFADDPVVRLAAVDSIRFCIDRYDVASYSYNVKAVDKFIDLATSTDVKKVIASIDYFLKERPWYSTTLLDSDVILLSSYIISLILYQKYMPSNTDHIPKWMSGRADDMEVFNPAIRTALSESKINAMKKFGDEPIRLYMSKEIFDANKITFAAENGFTALSTYATEIDKKQVLLQVDGGWLIAKNVISLRGLKTEQKQIKSLTEKQAKDELARLRVVVKNTK